MVFEPSVASTGGMVEPTLHGATVVFASEGDLWVADLGADSAESIPAHRLTSGQGRESRPIFSLDGTHVVFSASTTETRTWGGVIGIRADKPSIDGGITTQPEYAWWEPKRGWSLENSRVAPDIEVSITSGDRMENRDPQLDRGIRELLETLEKNPSVRPEAPPYPGR